MDVKVAIVVPTHKEKINIMEQISLIQLSHILGHYPIYFVVPDGLKVAFYHTSHYKIEYFDKYFFSSWKGYNDLLLTSEFYQKFSDYKYILIYQLDAFVFYDKLHFFCSLGYDYIGAPWPRFLAPGKPRIGNGGFSLRKVDGCLRALEYKERIFRSEQVLPMPEDRYFAECSRLPEANFRVPSIQEAASFSLEWDVSRRYSRLDQCLPFGCHAWEYMFFAWQPWIEKDLDEETKEKLRKEIAEHPKISFVDSRKELLFGYLRKRILRPENLSTLRSVWERIMPSVDRLSIWGYGKRGRRIYGSLVSAGREVHCIYDRDGTNTANIPRKSVYVPTKEQIVSDGVPILVTTSVHENEVRDALVSWGLVQDKDFYLSTDVEKRIGEQYIQMLSGKMELGCL